MFVQLNFLKILLENLKKQIKISVLIHCYFRVFTLHPMMQFSAAPWRYLSPEGVRICREFAELHVSYGKRIFELARHAAETGEPIVRTMEYEFPHQGFNRAMTQFMLGDDLLVAPVVTEDDTVVVELPRGDWMDDFGKRHTGPAILRLDNVPLSRLPRYVRLPCGTAQKGK